MTMMKVFIRRKKERALTDVAEVAVLASVLALGWMLWGLFCGR